MTAPSNDVLKNMIDNIEKKLDEHAQVHMTIVDLIKEVQLELRESNGWKNKFIGALAVIMIVVFPLMSWTLYQVVHIDKKIGEALANFEIEIVK